MKIIAFPFAGGNKYSFLFLKKLLPPSIDLNVLEYPGRGQRIKEPLLYAISDIVEDAWRRTLPAIEGEEDYVIYGHSMGGLVSYLITKRLAAQGLKKPKKLIVSGCRAPAVFEREKTFHLPSAEFWAEVLDLGGVPDEIAANAQMKTFFEPILRADFQVVEEYKYDGQAADLAIPIDVFYGSEEAEIANGVEQWRTESQASVQIHQLAGNHFFIYEHAAQIANHIIQGFGKNASTTES